MARAGDSGLARAPERLDSVYDDEDEVWDAEGRINGPAADVYSLGVCCFVALTGTDPFDFDGGEDNEDGSFCLVDSYAGMLERLEAGDVFNATSTEGFHIPPRAGAGVSAAALLLRNMKQGTLFKGVVPGLARSSLANGCSMVVYEAVHTRLSGAFGVNRKDVT